MYAYDKPIDKEKKKKSRLQKQITGFAEMSPEERCVPSSQDKDA